ncbi:preprotein translocase subunit SecG [Shewanella cyperi]|uniref:Protein-export membrane protein SecG n=1 Tax=Shewanella cyperi TaxID=2814292 RepID=A0A974XV77_9GAMM|nr:preprotein translocase subunit SecG [Shewanella cyperi]QSX30894.1 preprotein translocase subunit SecG [Shewanella cyperi]QSX41673.1 preprotein translocase subunit SecG [Shewanella cyperi]
MYEVLIVIYLLVALGLIGLVLIQQGKGADMGASFGAGASGTLFGSRGSGNFLTRSTAILAIAFFTLSLIIGNLSANHAKQDDQWKEIGAAEQVVEEAPQQAEKSENKVPD